MLRHTRVGLGLLGLVIALTGTHPVADTLPKAAIEEIRKELMQLPYYGVFDFIAFSYDNGVVTLRGYAYHSGLKGDAERAVKRVSSVKEVGDKIEELPPARNDDELRWKIYYGIYSDPFLARYAPGGGLLWGHRHAFGSAFQPLLDGPFTGMEPAGDYPIHIIVKNLHVTLVGVVDNDGDKTLAGVKASQVPGSLGVENALMVEKTKPSAKS